MFEFVVSILKYSSFFVGSYCLTRELFNGREQKSWILSGIISVVMSYIGLSSFPDLLLNINSPHFASFALGTSEAASNSCDCFIAFCLCDLLVGIFEYSEFIRPAEGWFHHCFYITLLSCFRILNTPHAFFIFAWCEIPTLFKAFGKIFPSTQVYCKILFKNSFLLLRVAVFSVVIFAFLIDCPYHLLPLTGPPALLVWCVHMWWGVKLISFK